MRKDTYSLIVRSSLLFMVSMLLVLGFWFHGEFYQLGLPLLLLLGGGATGGVILVLRMTMSDLDIAGNDGVLRFDRKDMHAVMTGVKDMLIDIPTVPIRAGGTFTAIVSEKDGTRDGEPGGGGSDGSITGRPFAEITVTDSHRVHRSGLGEVHATSEGFDSVEDLLGFLDGRIGRATIYHVIRFRVERLRGEG